MVVVVVVLVVVVGGGEPTTKMICVSVLPKRLDPVIMVEYLPASTGVPEMNPGTPGTLVYVKP